MIPNHNHIGNHRPTPMGPQFVDETRYQTIGRGFSEISGVPFKIAEKYQIDLISQDLMNQVARLHVTDDRARSRDSMYTFELERKVLENMGASY